MRNLLRLGLVCWSCIALCGSIAASAADAPPSAPAASEATISVHLAGGRTFTAVMDARTDARQLWLRFQLARAGVLRPIDWDRIVSAEVAGHKLSGEELRRLVEQVRQELPARPVTPAGQTDIVMIGSPRVGQQAERRPAETSGRAVDARRIVSLSIDATVGRWDENVEPDGLVVHVYPLDADGAVVPVRGTLEVDFKVEQRSINLLHRPFLDAGHWSEAVRTADFGPSGAVYRLRFQSVHPEFDDSVRQPGSVHACLTVPGQGTFEASTYLSFIRPFNPVRNHLQALTRHGYFPGFRYFSDERTGDGRR